MNMPPLPKKNGDAKAPAKPKTASMSRATCPVCGRDVAVRAGGEIREHASDPSRKPPNLCWGTGRTVEQARALMSR
jgi:hypothetical protein